MNRLNNIGIATILSFLLLYLSTVQNAIAFNEVDLDNTSIDNPFEPKLPKPKKPEKPDRPKPQKPRAPRGPIISTKTTETGTQTPQKPERPALHVLGLIWNSDRPQAIINGRVVDIGDSISNVKIIAIRKNEIDVEFNGEFATIKP